MINAQERVIAPSHNFVGGIKEKKDYISSLPWWWWWRDVGDGDDDDVNDEDDDGDDDDVDDERKDYLLRGSWCLPGK